MATYSFMDVTASLSGPTGEIDLGYGSASSEEGITVAMGGPKNTMTIGADGEVMHSLQLMFDDIDLLTMLQLVARVVADSLGNFLPVSPTSATADQPQG